jgi:hypothetical protein
MKEKACTLNPPTSARRTIWLAYCNPLPAFLAGMLLIHAPTALAALTFERGTLTVVGSINFASSPDSVIITGALVAPGAINTGLNIPVNRIQYDIINSDQGEMFIWTIRYSPVVGPNIVGAFTPLGYVTSSGTVVSQGGVAYATLFNKGFGPYSYNTGAPWVIDYEPDHITFTATTNSVGLPANDGVGYLAPASFLPSFGILFSPSLGNGLVPVSATIATGNSFQTLAGQVYGPLPGNPCLTIQCTNVIVQTCEQCASVFFSATAIDPCCGSNVILQYDPPPGACFPLNSTNVVTVSGTDSCGNSATNYFTVAVLPGAGCGGTNCISIFCSNIVLVTCSNCATTPFTATAVDLCCPNAAGGPGPTIVYNPPPGTCFPVNTTTAVEVTAFDDCGNVATNDFTVTVLPGANCGTPANCLTLSCSNIVALTCDDCATVPYTATAVDACCPATAAPPTIIYNPPPGTCFPVGTTNLVEVTAFDGCRDIATNYFTVTVLRGPNCGGPTTNCISILCSNIVALTCSNCATVLYSATIQHPCCPLSPVVGGVNVTYNPPATTCFPVNSTNLVQVTAVDGCGNSGTNYFTVTVLPGPNCGGTANCISISCSNIVVLTCSNCTTVPFNATAVDYCCSTSPAGAPGGLTLIYNPPATTCFPVDSTNIVQVTAYDDCGNVATTDFTVTVLPGPNCGGNSCISLSCPNINAFTCSNCTTVPFAATASDACCSSGANLIYNPPPTTCFPLNSTNVVQVIATDGCNNAATNYFLVTVLPGPNCLTFGGPNNGPGTGNSPNPLTLSWPVSNGQLQQSTDLVNWSPVPGVANSPYMVTNPTPTTFYRLQYY